MLSVWETDWVYVQLRVSLSRDAPFKTTHFTVSDDFLLSDWYQYSQATLNRNVSDVQLCSTGVHVRTPPTHW